MFRFSLSVEVLCAAGIDALRRHLTKLPQVEIIKKVPNEVNEKFYGCGAPLPLGVEGRIPFFDAQLPAFLHAFCAVTHVAEDRITSSFLQD